MTEATERFFASLPARAPAVLRAPVSGTLQIELGCGNRTEHWHLVMHPGAIEVNRDSRPADAVWYCDEQIFDRLITGEAQALAAVLRNETTFSGNVLLYLVFRNFFPNPPGVRDPRETAREHADRERAERARAVGGSTGRSQ